MKTDSIIDSRLWVRLDLDVSLKANSFFHTNPYHRAHLAAQLLLYDRVVIPTKDFGILPILISWMGPSCFYEALETHSIGFVRPMSLLGYTGNGNAISGFEIRDTPEKPFNWYQASIFGPIEEAPDLQLRHQCPFLTRQERVELVRLVLSQSKALNWENDLFMKSIVQESYKDIMQSPELSQFVLAHEPKGTESVHLTHLAGVAPNEFRVLNIEQIRDGIDLVLRVAEVNLEILMAHLYGKADLGTSVGAETILRQKLARSGATPQLVEKFQRLLELENIPDIRPIVAAGDVSVQEIWKLRRRKEARRFRKWLREAEPVNARDLEKAYVAALGKSSVYASLPARIIRFILTTAVGAVEPISGTIAGATDSFFIEKWLEGYSPRLFLERIRALPGSDRNKTDANSAGNR